MLAASNMQFRQIHCARCNYRGPIYFIIEACNERVERFRIWYKTGMESVTRHQGIEVETLDRKRHFIELSETTVVVSRPRRVDGFLTEWKTARSGLSVEELREATLQVLNNSAIPDNCWSVVDFIWELLKNS